uniref:nuclear RNA export factor 1 isoform X1 n=2 Tax=Myxine glutinosa TaxID=7769 RepID=UPI00358FD9D9
MREDGGQRQQQRFLPYSRGRRNRNQGKNLEVAVNNDHSTGHATHGHTMRKDPGWHKIMIPYGKKYDRNWLLQSIQAICVQPFIPIQIHNEQQKVVFYVEDGRMASSLRDVSHRIIDRDNCKIAVIANPSAPPPPVQRELKEHEIEFVKQCLSQRFDPALQSLDLQALRSDQGLQMNGIDVVLNRKNIMETVVKIICENIPSIQALNVSSNRLYRLDDLAELVKQAPALKLLNLSKNELKFERELDKIKDFRLEELWLQENPMCENFHAHNLYISAVRHRFPRLIRLDGLELPPPITFDVPSPTTLPAVKDGYFPNEDIRALIQRFIQQYISVYDSGDRQGLLNAYHENSCCSISIPNNASAKSNLAEYVKDSRNIKKLKDPVMRQKLLKRSRLCIVAFLNELPSTLHDPNSFLVDVHVHMPTMLSFTLNGVFKETEGKYRDSIRAFSRVFITIPAENGGLCIVNDELFVRTASGEEIRRAFVTPAPTPSSSPVPTLLPPQQDMLQTFSLQSGMNLEWSQKCLQDNDWDFNKSAQVFLKLQGQGSIPPEAFKK